MTTQKFHHDYPYRLKIQHFEGAELRLERKGRWIRVDPVDAVAEGDAVVLTAASAARAGAVARALRAGTAFTLVASAEVLAWARSLATGPLDGHADDADIDGVRIAVQPYAPATAGGGLHVGAFVRAAAAGLRAREESFPALPPCVLQFTFPDGARLVHMDLSLHARTDARWLEDAATHFGGAEWTIVGQPWAEAEAVARLAPRLGSRRLLVTELLNGERRALGLPTELVTPLRDRLVAAGVEAHVFATQTSYRFE